MNATAHARLARYIDRATASFENGFSSKAGQKAATDDLNRAYEVIRDASFDAVRAIAFAKAEGTTEADYAARNEIFRAHDMPLDLHQVRDRHIDIITKTVDMGATLRDLVDLRAAIKAAPVVPPVRANAEVEAKVAAVRAAIVDELARRRAQYAEALELGRLFGGLRVYVNAHWVVNEHGTQFLRHYFYLNGRLTPLQVILAAADTLRAEKEAA